MPIPDLNPHGLLPPGVYDCTFEEIRSRFGWNAHREGLLSSFKVFLTTELRPRFRDPVLFDGSFVTDKDQPVDTDVVLDLVAAPDARKWQGLQFMHAQQARLMALYRVHFWVNLPGANDFAAFFQYVGVKTAKFKGLNPTHLKGILGLA